MMSLASLAKFAFQAIDVTFDGSLLTNAQRAGSTMQSLVCLALAGAGIILARLSLDPMFSRNVSHTLTFVSPGQLLNAMHRACAAPLNPGIWLTQLSAEERLMQSELAVTSDIIRSRLLISRPIAPLSMLQSRQRGRPPSHCHCGQTAGVSHKLFPSKIWPISKPCRLGISVMRSSSHEESFQL